MLSTSLFVVLSFLTSAFAFLPPHRTAFKSSLNMVDFTLDPKETSFVFIEYQNEFTTDGGKLHGAVKECMENTNSTFLLIS